MMKMFICTARSVLKSALAGVEAYAKIRKVGLGQVVAAPRTYGRKFN
jgi:hypothetical protein